MTHHCDIDSFAAEREHTGKGVPATRFTSPPTHSLVHGFHSPIRRWCTLQPRWLAGYRWDHLYLRTMSPLLVTERRALVPPTPRILAARLISLYPPHGEADSIRAGAGARCNIQYVMTLCTPRRLAVDDGSADRTSHSYLEHVQARRAYAIH
jgi:hypothetical protein